MLFPVQRGFIVSESTETTAGPSGRFFPLMFTDIDRPLKTHRQPNTNSPLWAARSVPLGCFLHQTSCLGNGAHSNHGFSVGNLPEVCGRTCTAPLVCTAEKKNNEDVFSAMAL